MDSTSLTVLIAVAFLILAVITSFISARVGQRSEPELIDFPGSGLLIKPRRKKERFSPEWWSNWIQGLSTELVGAAIATLLIGVVVGAVQKNEADDSLRRQLVAQMGSPNNDFAIEAVRQLEALGWLWDGSLQGARLPVANLQSAQLSFANLQDAFLFRANLSQANLSQANLQNVSIQNTNLQDAYLGDANLQNAYVWDANLSRVNLVAANLQGAILVRANLAGAFLEEANLQDADLREAKFNEFTILPDGTNWAPETDMTRFTDPNHPQFWRSTNPESPAYGGTS